MSLLFTQKVAGLARFFLVKKWFIKTKQVLTKGPKETKKCFSYTAKSKQLLTNVIDNLSLNINRIWPNNTSKV